MSITQQEIITQTFIKRCRNTGYSLAMVNFKRSTAVIERAFGGEVERKHATLTTNGKVIKMVIGDIISNEEFDNFLINFKQ